MNGSFTVLSKIDFKKKKKNRYKETKKYTPELLDYHRYTATQEGKSEEYNQKKEGTGFNT